MSEQKTAIVTGGGTGIGLAAAARLLADGYRVIAAGMDHADLPNSVEFLRTDVTDANDVATLIGRTDRIDGLVNCAGIIGHDREWTPDGFDQVMAVNLSSSFNMSMAAHDKLRAARGAIVNISSMWAYFGSATSPAYAASKSAIVGLTRSLAVSWATDGIRVNAVAPGWVTTRLSAGARNDPDREPQITARIPMQRWGEPEEIATVIQFLLSEDASYVTGALLPVDGGFSIG